jgi:hypothetical protein
MQIDRIEVEFSMTVNLGNYESAKPAVRLSATLDGNEDLAEGEKILSQECERLWAIALKRHTKLLDEIRAARCNK